MNEDLNWTSNDMLEVTLSEPDDFLKVRETLSRIGVASCLLYTSDAADE